MPCLPSLSVGKNPLLVELAGFEGRHALASPGRGYRVSVCPQRVGWPSALLPQVSAHDFTAAKYEKSERSEICFMLLFSLFFAKFAFFAFFAYYAQRYDKPGAACVFLLQDVDALLPF